MASLRSAGVCAPRSRWGGTEKTSAKPVIFGALRTDGRKSDSGPGTPPGESDDHVRRRAAEFGCTSSAGSEDYVRAGGAVVEAAAVGVHDHRGDEQGEQDRADEGTPQADGAAVHDRDAADPRQGHARSPSAQADADRIE